MIGIAILQHAMMICAIRLQCSSFLYTYLTADKLSMDNLELLKTNLSTIGREDLRKLVEEYEKEECIRKYPTIFEYCACIRIDM